MQFAMLLKKYWNFQVKGFEAIKRVHFEPVPFDVERNLITPTFKLKRAQLLQYYKVSFCTCRW